MAEAQINSDLAQAEKNLKQLLNIDPGKEKQKKRHRTRNRKQAAKEPNGNSSENNGVENRNQLAQPINGNEEVVQEMTEIKMSSKKHSNNDDLNMAQEKKKSRNRRSKKQNEDSEKLHIKSEGMSLLSEGTSLPADPITGKKDSVPSDSQCKVSPNATGPPVQVQQNQRVLNPEPKGNSKTAKTKQQKVWKESSPNQRFQAFEKRKVNKNNCSVQDDDDVEGHLDTGAPVQDSKRHQQQLNPAEETKKENEKLSKRQKNRLLSGEEEKVDKSVLREMERQRVFPLKKKSLKFPKARFFCRLCDYHLDRVVDFKRHVSDARHLRRKEVTDSEVLLCNMPAPMSKQLAALDAVVESVFTENCLTEQDVRMRAEIVQEVEAYIKNKLPDTNLRIYGSSATGFGLKSSDINIDLFAPNATSVPKVLSDVFLLLKDSDGLLENVHSDFSAICPAILFNHPKTGVQCQISVNSNAAFHTGQLLALYGTMDSRLNKLAVVFRYWAKLCHLDNQQEGTLPAYATNLMTIFYLQHVTPPVLPVLSQGLPDNPEETEQSCTYFEKLKTESESWTCHNSLTVGELWLGLLRYYSLTFDMANVVVSIRKTSPIARSEKKWNSKKLAIEDPFATKRNIARTVSNSRIYEYFQDTLRKAYHYFGLPRQADGKSLIPEEALSKMIEKARKEEIRKEDRLEAEESDDNDKPTVNKENSRNDSTNERNPSTSEVTGDTSAQISPDFTFPDLTIPLEDEGIKKNDDSDMLAHSSFVSDSVNGEAGQASVLVSRLSLDEESDSSHQDNQLWQFAKRFSEKIIKNAVCEFSGQVSTCADHSEKDCSKVVKESSNDIPSDVQDISQISRMIENKDCCYQFTEKNLTDGKGPAIICGYCEKEGHLKTACPDDMLPDLITLPPPDKQLYKILTNTLKQVPKDFGPTYMEAVERDQILVELQTFINVSLYEDAELCLFGSSCNGFGFRMSDLDICMTFRSQPSGKNLNYPTIVEKLARVLKGHRGLYSILAIPTAKVPIVKFKHRRSQLEADISLYNTLAQHNTRLLEIYSLVDSRVKILGYGFKVFAKVCEIGDASRGSLSSYAYVLMVIHYLQQCNPPVCPVLQELYEGDVKPVKMIDGCNAWFFDDLQRLPFVWEECGRNSQSVGELWLDLFRFYTERFNYKDEVVCIRQKAPLTRFEKLWNGKCIAIEDPFDLKHNLGAGLSRKMNNYIFKALIHGRELYGTPIKFPGKLKYMSTADYYFDRTLLTEGSPPNDRGCRVCGKIGHIAKECHIVVNRKEREERGRKVKAAQDQEKRQENFSKNNMNPGNQACSPQKTMYSHPQAGSPLKQTYSPGYRINPGPFRAPMTPNKYVPQGKPQNSSPASAGYAPIRFDPAQQQMLLQPRSSHSAQHGFTPPATAFPMQVRQAYPPHSNTASNIGHSFQYQNPSAYNSYPVQMFNNNAQSFTNVSRLGSGSSAPMYMSPNSNAQSKNSNGISSALTGSPIVEVHRDQYGRIESQTKKTAEPSRGTVVLPDRQVTQSKEDGNLVIKITVQGDRH